MKNKLTLQPKKAFTLVELIVVVTILAIIWTIWFVSYTDYLSWVRDTNRTVQLESIWDWLKLSLTRWRLPIPDDYIEVKTSWDTIAYQGYAWEEVLKKIKYDKEGKDPLDNTYFSYYATDNRKNFQLMALLEETNETVSLFKGEVLSNDIDYADRQVKVSWKKLWILTGGWDNLNVPVQEIWEIKDNWELDIATTPDEYISHIDDSDKISWSWSELIKSIYNSSCKRILESSLDNWDWVYKINPSGLDEFEVYCDMSTDWGGWTLVLKAYNWDTNSFYNTEVNKILENDSELNSNNNNLDKSDFKWKWYMEVSWDSLMAIDLSNNNYFVSWNINNWNKTLKDHIIDAQDWRWEWWANWCWIMLEDIKKYNDDTKIWNIPVEHFWLMCTDDNKTSWSSHSDDSVYFWFLPRAAYWDESAAHHSWIWKWARDWWGDVYESSNLVYSLDSGIAILIR